jgi:hypothetical protein
MRKIMIAGAMVLVPCAAKAEQTNFTGPSRRYRGTTTQQGTASNPLALIDGSNPFGRRK